MYKDLHVEATVRLKDLDVVSHKNIILKQV